MPHRAVGAHPDVTLVRTEKLSIGVDEVRELVRRAAMAPTLGGRQVLVVEDADRVTERGADALLKAIEEPASRTVWLLCAPTPDDVIVTIRSRCRRVELATPSEAAIAPSCWSSATASRATWPPTPPGSRRATSGGPARSPATRTRGAAAARSSASPPS